MAAILKSNLDLPPPGPPVPPVKPQKFQHQLQPTDSFSSLSSAGSPAELLPLPEHLQPISAGLASHRSLQRNELSDDGPRLPAPLCGYVERLKKEAVDVREETADDDDDGHLGDESAERRGLDRSSYHHAIAALENTSEEEEEAEADKEEKRGRRGRSSFLRPVIETESTFRPADFGSRLLPPENKPLEMVVLKRAKELLLSHNHHSIARHLLVADCQVFTHIHTHMYGHTEAKNRIVIVISVFNEKKKCKGYLLLLFSL